MKTKIFLLVILILMLTVSAQGLYTVTYSDTGLVIQGEDIASGKKVLSPAQTESRALADNITNESFDGWTTTEGSSADELYAVIDLEKEHSIGTISFVLNEASKEVESWSVWLSDDGEEWQEVFVQRISDVPAEMRNIKVDFANEPSGRYVKLQADSGTRFGMNKVKIFEGTKPAAAIQDVLIEGEDVSVLVSGDGVVFVTLFDESNNVHGVYFTSPQQGLANFKIKKDEKTKSLKINFLKDIETMEPIDSVRIDL